MSGLEAAQLVGLGGAVGAVARHAVARRLNGPAFPSGTLAVNVLGSFALAVLTFGGVGGDAGLFLGTGALGAFTTFSSFSVETVHRFESGERGRALAYAAGTFLAAALGVGLAWLLVGPA